jgi:tRNA dimethylallyltransferase
VDPVIAIVGPTASGKSELAQRVALRLGGEIISADSMQIYRGLNIGTAKLSPQEMQVTHHLIDIVDPGEAFSAQQYQSMARTCISALQSQQIVPILCGGTGLYVQATLEDMKFPKGEYRSEYRLHLESLAEDKGRDYLWDMLKAIDPDSAQVIHPHNTRRVVRALEMAKEGTSYAIQSKNIKTLDEVIPSLRFALKVDPAILHERINARVDKMIEKGLVEEVKALLNSGFKDALTASEAIGYKEILSYLKGEYTLDQAIEQIKTATRRYAKRQRSWFKRDKNIQWLDTETLSLDEMTEVIVSSFCSARTQGNKEWEQ